MKTTPRDKCSICLPFERSTYDEITKDSKKFRSHINDKIAHFPELFPVKITGGYEMKDSRKSKKLCLCIRRIIVAGKSYSVRPSFVLPYMTGFVSEVEKALYLRRFDVPFYGLAYVFGHCPMYWYRLENHLGRNSLVGTTIHRDTALPPHLVADETHSDLPAVIVDPIKKLRKNIKFYSGAYDHPECHRTSNMLDRLMQRMDRHLFSTQYFHSSSDTAELNIRGWALIYNFTPSNPMTIKKHQGKRCPADRLNGFAYHENWLENLLISASLKDFRLPP